jgi:hypothetical protein
LTPLEQAYYLGVMSYIKALYGDRSEGYSMDVRHNLKSYLSETGIRKLQLGTGASSHDGWLGTDIAPQSDGVVYLDATKPFPFDDDTFDYVHCEHTATFPRACKQ